MSEPELIAELKSNPQSAAARYFESFRPRLLAMLEYRMDTRLFGRFDPEDVLQATWMTVSRRVNEFIAHPDVSFFLWVRQLAYQNLVDFQRGQSTQKRDIERELSLRHDGANALPMTRVLIDSLTSPSEVYSRAEQIQRLDGAIRELRSSDQEILELVHFEQLSVSEAAEVIGISRTAAGNRHLRALRRLQGILVELTGSSGSYRIIC